MKYLRYFFLLINIGLILALFISYLAAYITPEANRIIPLFGLFFPYFFFLNVCCVLGWLFTKKWTYSLLSFCALLIGYSAANRFISFDSKKVFKSPEVIQVSSYNLASGLLIRSKQKEDFYQFIEDQYQDGIFFFQESSTTILNKLEAKFPKEHFVRLKGKRATIMSHFPVVKSGIIDFKDNYNVCVWADVKIADEIVRVYSVHLQSNQVTRIAEDVRSNGDLGDKETWSNLKTMMGRYTKSTVKRRNQVEKILKNVESVDYPVIVVGDFNDIPQSYLYTDMSNRLKDAFVERGFGLGTSFNGSIPALRIDYIFLDRSFQILDYKTHRLPFSDHYPISSKVIFYLYSFRTC